MNICIKNMDVRLKDMRISNMNECIYEHSLKGLQCYLTVNVRSQLKKFSEHVKWRYAIHIHQLLGNKQVNHSYLDINSTYT